MLYDIFQPYVFKLKILYIFNNKLDLENTLNFFKLSSRIVYGEPCISKKIF